MNQIIGLKELKANIGAYAKKAQAGHSFIVVKQSKPLFRISSPVIPDFKEASLEEADGKGWKTILDFRKIKPRGVRFEEVIKAIENEQNAKIYKKIGRKRPANHRP